MVGLTSILSVGGALLGKAKESKLEAVASGSKTVTKPKTFFGKLIGGVTGRTQAYNYQEELKSAGQLPSPVSSSRSVITRVQGNTSNMSTPIASGSIQFGDQQKQANLPQLGLLAVVVIAVVYFISGKPKRRRR